MTLLAHSPPSAARARGRLAVPRLNYRVRSSTLQDDHTGPGPAPTGRGRGRGKGLADTIVGETACGLTRVTVCSPASRRRAELLVELVTAVNQDSLSSLSFLFLTTN